jgi:6-phosphogluconate dehydrogenase
MRKHIIAPIVMSGALLAGATTVGFAGTAYASTPAATVNVSLRGVDGPVAKWVRAHRQAIRKAVVSISAKTIGVTPQDLVSELQSGKSITDVAGEHGVSEQTVASALVIAADAAINQAVAKGHLSSARATRIEAEVPGYATTLVNHTF